MKRALLLLLLAWCTTTPRPCNHNLWEIYDVAMSFHSHEPVYVCNKCDWCIRFVVSPELYNDAHVDFIQTGQNYDVRTRP
jgi:RNase P subunit RPR2